MQGFLVVDMMQVLDESALGKSGADALKQQYDDARERFDALREQAKAAVGPARQTLTEETQAYESEALAELDAKREALRDELLEAARAHVEALRAERKAELVLDARAVVLCADAIDITREVIARLNDAGETEPA